VTRAIENRAGHPLQAFVDLRQACRVPEAGGRCAYGHMDSRLGGQSNLVAKAKVARRRLTCFCGFHLPGCHSIQQVSLSPRSLGASAET
jgi:hypothetical protein